METANAKRYKGLATSKRFYTSEILVKCPKCHKEATVFNNLTSDKSENKLVCNNCCFTEFAEDLIRYKSIVNRSCDNCGKEIRIEIPNNKEKVESLAVSCPHCEAVRTFKPRNDSYQIAYKNTGIGDPIFNLPLWFQCDVKGNSFYAYNREHLNEIKNYVSAKLRERQTQGFTTMVEKLPNFIKEAKNRTAIVKAIDNLLRTK